MVNMADEDENEVENYLANLKTGDFGKQKKRMVSPMKSTAANSTTNKKK